MRTGKLCAERPNTRYRAFQWQQTSLANCLDTLCTCRRTLPEPTAPSFNVEIDAHYQENSVSFTQDNLYGFYRAS